MQYRIRRVQAMVLLELLLRPLPDAVAARVETFADELGLGDDCRDAVAATRHLASGATGAALADFMRNGYEVLHLERTGEDPPPDIGDYWASVPDDPALAARWAALEHCPAGSLGRGVWEFYKARGFNFPGTPNSVSPRLAQHDFVHVLSDYGTTVESEIEVFAVIARADEDPRSFSLLVAVLALFESGYLDQGLGAFRADPDHLSDDPAGMGTRLGNAVARGGEVAWRFRETDGIDLLAVDWFARADGRRWSRSGTSTASPGRGPSRWRRRWPDRRGRSNPVASPRTSWLGPRHGGRRGSAVRVLRCGRGGGRDTAGERVRRLMSTPWRQRPTPPRPARELRAAPGP